MYVRVTKRKNKNGSVAEYYQLVQTRRHPKTKIPTTNIIYNFGRAERVDHKILTRLCNSVARVCGLKVIDSAKKDLKNQTSIHSESTNHELLNQVKALKKELANLKKVNKVLKENELKYHQLLEHDLLGIVVISDFRIVFANSAAARMSGRSFDELLSFKPEEMLSTIHPDDQDIVISAWEGWLKGISSKQIYEIRMIRKNGEILWVQNHSAPIIFSGKPAVMAAYIDITDLRKAEASSIEHAENLEEANIALRVLLKRRDEDKKETEEKVVSNVKELVLPFIDELKASEMSERQKTFLNIVESNLNDIISPFARTISSKHHNFTHREMQVANLIRQGKLSKEIAEALSVSTHTVDTYRQNIRKKMKIYNKNKNLRTCLISLK
jgi:PAS domain S-box-containing protein